MRKNSHIKEEIFDAIERAYRKLGYGSEDIIKVLPLPPKQKLE